MSLEQEKPNREIGGTIGDLSSAVGLDVRELFISGYSYNQVLDVAHGKMTLSEMRAQGPHNKPVDTKKIMDEVLKRKQGK